MGLSLHRFVESDELIARLGIAIFILNQYSTDTVALNHLDKVGIQRWAVEFDDDHLSEFLIQAHALHDIMRQLAVR